MHGLTFYYFRAFQLLCHVAMSPKKNNITFNALMEEELLDLMYEQVLLGCKADRGFKMDAYKYVTEAMTKGIMEPIYLQSKVYKTGEVQIIEEELLHSNRNAQCLKIQV